MLLQEVKHKLVDNKMFDTAIGRYRNRCKVKNLYCEFAKLIKKYRRDSLQEDMTLPLSDYIFVCWWQGEADMSPMIRECYQRIKQFNTDKKVILITADNMNQWVQFPDYIITKFNEGKITKTHMSDLLRCALLRDWGGVWMDITIYTFAKLPERCYKLPIYTCRNKREKHTTNVSYNRWTSYFLVSRRPNNVLFRYMSDFFAAYLKKYDSLNEYFLVDYAIAVGYKYISSIRAELNAVDMNGCGPDNWRLLKLMREDYDEQMLEDIKDESWFQKLARQGEPWHLEKAKNPDRCFYNVMFLKREE